MHVAIPYRQRQVRIPYTTPLYAAGYAAAGYGGYRSVAKDIYGFARKGYRAARRLYRGAQPVINSTVTRPIRRPVRARKFRGKRGRKQLVKRVRELSQKAAQGEGLLVYRTAAVGALIADNNVQNFASLGINDLAITESVLGQLRYYDPSAPSALVTADFTSGTYQRKIHIDKVTAMLLLRNNYQSCVKVTVYTCKAKNDTSISPTAAFVNGMTDSGNDTAGTNPLSYLTDSPQFDELWKIVKKNVYVLSAGDEITVSSAPAGYYYDASLADSHSLTYQRELNSHAFAIFVQGLLSHDSAVANEQGLCKAGIDYQLYRTFRIKYEAGVNIHYTYVSNNYDTPTNGFVQSVRPISDNITYSVA